MQTETKHIQFKATETGLEGYAATFNNVDRVNDVIVQGAFIKSISKFMPKFCLQHDSDDLIGVISEAYEDANGLYIKASFANIQCAQDARELVKMGAIQEMSIGYSVVEAEYRQDGVRLLKEIDLYEVSLVTFPANEKAKITRVKSLPQTEREFESFLRDVGGYPIAAAKAITAQGFKALGNLRDEEAKQLEEVAQLTDVFKQFNQSFKG